MRLRIFLILLCSLSGCASLSKKINSDIISYHFKNDLKNTFIEDKEVVTYYISNNIVPNSEILRILKGNYSESDDYSLNMTAASKYYSSELEEEIKLDQNFNSFQKWDASELQIVKKPNVEFLISSSLSNSQQAFNERTFDATSNKYYQLVIYSRPLEIATNIYALYSAGKRTYSGISLPTVFIYEVKNNSIELIEKVQDQRLY